MACVALVVFPTTFAIAEEDDEAVAGTVDVARLERDRVSASDETATSQVVPFQLIDRGAASNRSLPTTRRPSGVAMQSIPCPHIVDLPEEVPTAPVARSSSEEWLEWLGLVQQGEHRQYGSAYIPSPERRTDPRFAAAQRLVHHYGFRKLRSLFRGELKDRMEDDPSFSYTDYMQEREQINMLGRSDGSSQSQQEVDEARRTVLRSDLDDELASEQDLALLGWGPFQIDDKGRLKIDVDRLRSEPSLANKLEIAPEEMGEEQAQGKSLFEGRTYRMKTSVKLRPRVDRYEEGFRNVLGEVGAKFQIDFFSPILEERYMATELETTFDEEGRTAFFVTLKLYGR